MIAIDSQSVRTPSVSYLLSPIHLPGVAPRVGWGLGQVERGSPRPSAWGDSRRSTPEAIVTNCFIPVNLCAMVREFSAGGVVLRRLSGSWWIAAIEPEKEDSEPSTKASLTPRRRLPRKTILALPK